MARRKRANPGLIKIHRNYSVEEAAAVLSTHKHTVRRWLAGGLQAIDSKRPTLIHGAVLREFLTAKRRVARRPCSAGQIYCVRCRKAQEPAAGMVDYIPMGISSGNLRGICPDCGALIHRRVSLAGLDAARGKIEVAFPESRQRIGECNAPSDNGDFGKAG